MSNIVGHNYHVDSFGTLQTTLAGGSQWTMRLMRGTKVAMPHIAKADTFTYICQFNHNKNLGVGLDDFHIHMKPMDTVVAGNVIAIDYAWGWFTNGDVFPNTLPNTGTVYITLVAGDQYKTMIKPIVSSYQILSPLVAVTPIPAPTGETYSSEFYIECTRRNDGTDTYAGEFALCFGDVHFPVAGYGSYNVLTD